MLTFARRAMIPVGLAVLNATCKDQAPTIEELVGVYEAIVFTTEEDGTTIDRLATGASITLTLELEGSTTGRLFVPGGGEDGSDLDAELTGSWTLNGDTVELSHAADTFLRDMTFTAEGMQLSGQATFGVTITVVLAK